MLLEKHVGDSSYGDTEKSWWLALLDDKPIVELRQANLVKQTRVVSGFSRTMGKEVTSILMGPN